MSKTSLKEITLEGFRGIYNKNTLEFGNCRGIILYGDNGTGKTSFSEGAEWLFYGRIEKLKREGCSDADLRHLRFPISNEAYVEIKLADGSTITKSISNDSKVTIKQPTKNILEGFSRDNIILSYTKLREFVDQTKKQKLVSFLEVSGYGDIPTIRDTLQRSLGKIEQEIQRAVLESQIDGFKEQIATKAGGILGENIEKDSINPDYIINFIKNLLKTLSERHKLEINLSDEITDIIKEIENTLLKEGAGRNFLQLEEFQRLIKNIEVDQKLSEQINEMQIKTQELFNDKDKVEALSLGAFYQTGKELFEKLNYSKNVCPFCDQAIANDKLRRLIDDKLQLSSNLNKDKSQILDDLENINQTIKIIIQNVNPTQNYYKNCFDKSLTFQDINPELAIASYKRDVDRLSPPKELIIKRITDFPTKVGEVLKQLKELSGEKAKKIKKPSSKLNEISEAVIKIKDIQFLFSNLKKLSLIKKEFETQRQTLEKILKIYEEFERETMDSVLKAISKDLNDFYTILHRHDEHEDVRLDFSDKGRGITFKLNFHKQEVDQPIKYLSDSHLNSLGLCFFLASVKHLNKMTNLIILDDVVNSIDANHRRQLIEIIRDHFTDYQFLILTHDRTWFEMLNQQLEGLGWKSYEIMSWQLESVVIEPTKDRIQKVQDLINASNGEGVARHLRIYLEQEVKRLCKLYHVPIEYKEGYRLEDLWQPLKKHLKNYTYIDPNAQVFRGLFNDVQTNRYLFTLDLHDTSKRLTVNKGDMQYALDRYKDFLNLFRCKKCTQTVRLDKGGYQCPCGDKFTP